MEPIVWVERLCSERLQGVAVSKVRRKRGKRRFFANKKRWSYPKYLKSISKDVVEDVLGSEEDCECTLGDFLGFSENSVKKSYSQYVFHPLYGMEEFKSSIKVASFSESSSFVHSMIVTPIFQRKIRVLSLFDGISTALFILTNKLNLDIELYLSSEIDHKALRIQCERWNGKIIQLGDVRNLDKTMLSSFGRVDLVIGGSPCEELSLVNWRGRGLDDPQSSGNLFYMFKMVKEYFELAMRASGIPFFWLFENTCHMRTSIRDKITSHLGGKLPIKTCGTQYLPVMRPRYFWGNLPFMESKDILKTARAHLKLQDFLQPGRIANHATAKTITSNVTNQVSRKNDLLPVTMDGKECYLTINEIEVLMGFPSSYTDCNNLTPRQRLSLISKGWCIPVVENILKPLTELFKVKS